MAGITDLKPGKWYRGRAEFVEFIEPLQPTQDRPDGKAAQVKCKITATEGDVAGVYVTWWGSLKSGRAREITEKQLTAMGWTGKGLKTGRGIGSKDFVFLVERRNWQGKEYTNVKAIAEPKEFKKDDPFEDKTAASDADIPF